MTPTPVHPVVQPLPCAFCGADGDSIVVGQWLPTKWYTSCNDCESSGPPGRDRAAAIAAWNRRASLPAVQGEQPISIVEQIARQWDGCMYEAVGGEIDIGDAIRSCSADVRIVSGVSQDARTSSVAPGGQPLAQADEKDGLVDSVAAPVQPPGATLSPGAASQWQPIDTAPRDGTAILLGARGGWWIGKWCPVYPSGYAPDNPWTSLMLNHDHMGEKWLRPTHWARITPPGALVDGGESSSKGGES